MLPNFFVIGAAKCGTTSLAAYLAQHPEIHVSPVKEPRFFARAESGHPFPGRRVGSRAEYEALFDSDAPARGEASAAYSQHPRRAGVAARIRELIPDARFIYLVGDPIRRVESHYVQTVAEEGEERPIAEVLSDIEDPCHPAICPGRYARQLHQYLSLFPEDQLLVIDRDELLEHRGPTLSEVFAFLGVDPDYESAAFAQTHNRSADHRNVSSGLYGRLRRGPLRAAIRAVPPSLREPVLRRLRQVLADEVSRPLLERSLRARLEAEFAPEVTRLRELTGKRFASWSI